MYADYEYYSGTYGGTVPEPDISPRLRQAARDVDTLTFGRIHAVGLENLSAYQQEIIQECCCQLAEFAHENADVLESIVSGYSINGASLTLSGSSTAVETVSGICLPRAVYQNLCQTGLCCRSETRWCDAIP